METIFILAQGTSEVATLKSWDIIKLITPVIGTLAGAVGVLWKMIKSSIEKAEKRETKLAADLKECNILHRNRDELQVAMASKVGKLEGLMVGHEQAREDLRDLSKTVIGIIHERE